MLRVHHLLTWLIGLLGRHIHLPVKHKGHKLGIGGWKKGIGHGLGEWWVAGSFHALSRYTIGNSKCSCIGKHINSCSRVLWCLLHSSSFFPEVGG